MFKEVPAGLRRSHYTRSNRASGRMSVCRMTNVTAFSRSHLAFAIRFTLMRSGQTEKFAMAKRIVAFAVLLLACLVGLASAASSRPRPLRQRSAFGSTSPSSIPFTSGETMLLPDSICHRPQAQVQDCFDVRIWYTACWTGILRWNSEEGAATAELIIPISVPAASGTPPVQTLAQDCGTGNLFYAESFVPEQLLMSDPHGAKPPVVVQPSCIALGVVAGIGEVWFQCAGQPIQHLNTTTNVITPIPMGSMTTSNNNMVLDVGLHTMYILSPDFPVYTYDISTPTVPPKVLLTASQCPEPLAMFLRIPETNILLAACHYHSLTAFDLAANTSSVVMLDTDMCLPQSWSGGFAWSVAPLSLSCVRKPSST
jgi:hypothetical protein